MKTKYNIEIMNGDYAQLVVKKIKDRLNKLQDNHEILNWLCKLCLTKKQINYRGVEFNIIDVRMEDKGTIIELSNNTQIEWLYDGNMFLY